MSRAIGFALIAVALSACRPNPRNEIAAVAEVAMREAAKDAAGRKLCVGRAIDPWQPSSAAHSRVDTPAPPGFEPLRGPGVFRGGGALKGSDVGGVAVRDGNGCFGLRGPLIVGDQAMIEVHQPGIGWNVWQRKIDGYWRVVMTTTSVYPE